MKLLIIQTILFIIKKWDYEIQNTLTEAGKIALFLPWIVNNILTQVLYFSIFPIVMLYVQFLNKMEPYIKIIQEYRKFVSDF